MQTGQGGGSLLSLSDAVGQAARSAGVRPISSPEQLQADLEAQEVKEAYSEQVRTDSTGSEGELHCSLLLSRDCREVQNAAKCFWQLNVF